MTAPYWDAAKQGVLAIQYCPACALYQHPPDAACPSCHSTALEFRPVSGRGRVFVTSTMYQPRVVGFEDSVPFTCVAVELEEQPELLVLTNLVDAGPDEPVDEVEVTFEPIGDGFSLPQFRPRRTR
jgi:uncharacterized OB-fold protein